MAVYCNVYEKQYAYNNTHIKKITVESVSGGPLFVIQPALIIWPPWL